MSKKVLLSLMVTGLVTLMIGCVKEYKSKEAALDQPINCAHAEGEIRVLQSEKTHVTEQVKAGVQSIVPPALVGGLVFGTTETKAEIATGDYNDMLDAKIKEIKQTCGVR